MSIERIKPFGTHPKWKVLEERLEPLVMYFLPVSLIVLVSGYLELILDELGRIRVNLIF